MLLIGTKRMFARPTGSQIASASATSFLFVFTYGLTNCGAMRRTVCPKRCSVRPQSWALAQASIPITHGGRFPKNTATCLRRSCLRSTALRPYRDAFGRSVHHGDRQVLADQRPIVRSEPVILLEIAE